MTKPSPSLEFKRSVRWRDTDASGFANLAAFITWMEETEYAFLRSRGLSVVLEDDRGLIGFPRLHSELKILTPVTFEEELDVLIRLGDVDGKQVSYRFEITRARDQVMVATGRFDVACCRFPDGELPYAILIPAWVEDKLLGR